MLNGVSKQFWEKSKTWFLIIIGSFVWSLTMIKSGLVYSFGMGFWGANGHDAIWHIALAESLSRGDFGMPVFAGYPLQNYHIGFDLFLAALHVLTRSNLVNLYFQILPPLFAILIGYLVYVFVVEWTKSEKAGLWSLFFVYFGGSFGYLIGKGESAFWSQQAISTLINPPFALSLIFILSGLLFLIKYQKTSGTRYLILSILFFGSLMEIKVYAGVLVLGGLFCASVFEFFKHRRDPTMLIHINIVKAFAGSLAVSLIMFLLFERKSVSLLVWQPFWFLETMMGLTDRVGWLKFYSAMTTYKAGHIWFKEIPAYLIAFAVFWVGNMGIRIVKEFVIWKWIKNIRDIGWIEVFVSGVIVAGGLIPMFFLQKGTPWNTIQFFYYSLFFSSIMAGVSIPQILGSIKNTIVIRIMAVAIVVLTLPTTILTLKEVYLPGRPPAKLSNEELQALNFLKTQPGGVVLTYPFNEVKAGEAENNPPRPLYLYASTAYVSAFSSHPTFLEDEINLDITGYNWPERRSLVENWYKEKDLAKAVKFLKDNNIKYVYWLKGLSGQAGQRAFFGEGQLGLVKIFENKEVDVFVVKS